MKKRVVLLLVCLLVSVPVFVLLVLGTGGKRSEAAASKRPIFSIPLAGSVYQDGELIVKMSPGATAADSAKTLSGAGETRDLGAGTYLVKLPQGMAVSDGIDLYNKNSGVLEVSPNYLRMPAQFHPNDGLYAPSQWNMNNVRQTGGTFDADIDAPEAWDTVTGSGLPTGTQEVVVVVLDTGVDYTHPDLAGNMWVNERELRENLTETGTIDLIARMTNGIDDDADGKIDDFDGDTVKIGPRVGAFRLPILKFDGVNNDAADETTDVVDDFDGVALNGEDDDSNLYIDDIFGINAMIADPQSDPDSGDPMDTDGHGTHVAGIIGAEGNNGYGVAGVNWDVKMMACKFMDADGGDVLDEFKCFSYIIHMANRGVPIVVVNASFGGYFPSFSFEESWINTLRFNGIVLVAASGNDAVDNGGRFAYPASYNLPNIISVTATDHNDRIASWANFGKQNVHLGAPGVSIMSTMPGELFGGYVSGTSGTSMGAPHVTGAVAWLYPALEVINGYPLIPVLDWPFLRNRIIAGADLKQFLDGRTLSGRRLNLNGAITCSGREILARLQPITSEYFAWLTPTGGIDYTVIPRRNEVTAVFGRTFGGQYFSNPILLSALHIYCADSAGGSVTVTVGGQNVPLYDGGSDPDLETLDGVFMGTWQPPFIEGDFPARFPNVGTSLAGVSDTFTIHVRQTSAIDGDFVADAGRNTSAPEGTPVELDGTKSSGPLDRFLPLYYTWTQVAGTPVALANATSPVPTFTAPAFVQPVQGEENMNTLRFELEVERPDDETAGHTGLVDTDQVTVTVTPEGGGGGSSCFIATAAYGSDDAQYLPVLRSFRNEYLLTNKAGRAFVRLYYRVSPPVASVIEGRPALRAAVRVGLLPLVGSARLALASSAGQKLLVAVCLALAIGMFASVHRGRKRLRTEM